MSGHKKKSCVDVKKLDTLVDYLRGTCYSLQEACVTCGLDEDSLTDGERAYIDEHIIQCELCNWWEDAGEVDDNQQCDQCRDGTRDD